ncbi:hypothetical protein DFH28DRAFT_363660 [Melampsora americana]|nr:hypothetical protein DFH28DRAFT_363660 [Melampsora americana]
MKGCKALLILLLNVISLLNVNTAILPQDLAHCNSEILGQTIAPYQGLELAPQTQSNAAYVYPRLGHDSPINLVAHLSAIENHLMGGTGFYEPPVGVQTQFQDTHGVKVQGLDSFFTEETYTYKSLPRNKKQKNEEDHINPEDVVRKNKHLKTDGELCDSVIIDCTTSSNTKSISKGQNYPDGSTETEESEFMNSLQEKGNLVLQENKTLSNKVAQDFESLVADIVARYGHGHDCGYDIINFQESVKKIKTDVVPIFFGGLIYIFQDVQTGPSSEILLADGWEILYQKLQMSIFSPYNEFYNLSGPKNEMKSKIMIKNGLLEDILKLRLNSNIPPYLVFNLIKIWEKETSYSPHHYGIILKQFPFLGPISPKVKQIIRKRKAEEVTIACAGNSYATLGIPIRNKRCNGNHPVKDRCRSFLVALGRTQIKIHKDLIKELNIFFVEFQRYILDELQGIIPEFNQSIKTLSIKTLSIKTSESRQTKITFVIKKVKTDILPAFLAILWLTHQDQESEIPWDVICRSGWDFLKGYLSGWSEVLLNDPPVNGFHARKAFTKLDWSNTSDMIEYLISCKFHGIISLEPVWYIVDKWYDTLQKGKGGIVGSLGNMLDPPSRLVIHRKNQSSFEGQRALFSTQI